MMNKIGAGYQKSPGYQFNVDEATGGANSAAAAGGMLGSPAEQQALAQRISGIASQDYGDYMNRGLSQYGMGLQGMGNMAQMGYGASSDYAKMLEDQFISQAQLQYAGQDAENKAKGGMWGGIGGLLGGAAGLALGGPGGAMAGYGVGSKFFKG
jgi:hypothetical protein